MIPYLLSLFVGEMCVCFCFHIQTLPESVRWCTSKFNGGRKIKTKKREIGFIAGFIIAITIMFSWALLFMGMLGGNSQEFFTILILSMIFHLCMITLGVIFLRWPYWTYALCVLILVPIVVIVGM